MPKILPHQAVIFLLDHPMIVFLRGTASRQGESGHLLSPKTNQVLVKKLRAIIWMQLTNDKGHASEKDVKTRFHGASTATKNRHTLTPSGRHIDQLQGMEIFSCRTFSTVMNQIHLAVAWFLGLPGNTPHGDAFGQLISSLRSFLREASSS